MTALWKSQYSDDVLKTRTIYVKTVKDISEDLSPYAIKTASTKLEDSMKHYRVAVRARARTARMMSRRPLRSSRCRPKHSWSLQWRCTFPRRKRVMRWITFRALQKQERSASVPQVKHQLDAIVLSQLGKQFAAK